MGPPRAEDNAVCLEYSAVAEIEMITIGEGADVGPMDGAIAIVKHLPKVGYTCKTKARIAPKDPIRIHQQTDFRIASDLTRIRWVLVSASWNFPSCHNWHDTRPPASGFSKISS